LVGALFCLGPIAGQARSTLLVLVLVQAWERLPTLLD
jgi:hypothetical protein